MPLPLHTPPGHAAPTAALPATLHTGPPVPHPIVPVVHGFPVLHPAPDEHATQLPEPLHTPPAQPVPAARLPLALHTGPPVPHPIVPVVQGFPVLHGAPGEHAVHAPWPSHTPPEHPAPATVLPTERHIGAPDPQSIAPMVHALPVLHVMPAMHATHAPLPLQTVPAAHAPHDPPQPSPPHARPLHIGEHTQLPPALHERPTPHVPHDPPQPSVPHARPTQFGAQTQCPEALQV